MSSMIRTSSACRRLQSKVKVLFGIALTLASVTPVAEASPSDPPTTIEQWVEQDGIPIRSVDPGDTDFADLQALGRAIGDARIVQLGEMSHFAATDFLAKARIIAYLHQELGFDVLLFESGMADGRRVDEALVSGEPAKKAAPLGVFPLWSRTAEGLRVFEYAAQTKGTNRQLEIGGFDSQCSAPAGKSAGWIRSMARLAAAVDPPLVATSELEQAEQTLDRAVGLKMQAAMQQPAPEDADAFAEQLKAVSAMLERLEAESAVREAELRKALGARDLGWLQTAVSALSAYTRNLQLETKAEFFRSPEQFRESFERRDASNTRIVHYLVDEYYAGRKVILWGHNAHHMHAYVSADAVTGQSPTIGAEHADGFMQNMGLQLSRDYGDDLRTILFASATGTVRGAKLDPPVPGTVEAAVFALDAPHTVLDFRAARAVENHPLSQVPSMRLIDAVPVHYDGDWRNVTDLLFVHREVRSTR